MYSYDRREVTAAFIKEITKAYIRTYTDNGQTKAYVEWVDNKGKKGTTEGDPESTHMKALLDRAKREKVKIETQKWASWQAREAQRRHEWIREQTREAAVTDAAWERSIGALVDTSGAMKKQVDRFGGIEKALQEGHGTTIKQQLGEIASVLRVLQRRLGD